VSPAAQARAASASQTTQSYRLTATIQDLMDGIVDPSADVLWDSVAYIATKQGIEDRQPRTDEEWKTVRYSAITLSEAANLLSMPGRSVAVAHNPASAAAPPGLGELTHAEIQQRIDTTHDAFTQFARNLQDAAAQALTAIDAKNAQGLMEAGGVIDQACEACHVTYWYPNQSRPGN
jgi:cytochrome c556